MNVGIHLMLAGQMPRVESYNYNIKRKEFQKKNFWGEVVVSQLTHIGIICGIIYIN